MPCRRRSSAAPPKKKPKKFAISSRAWARSSRSARIAAMAATLDQIAARAYQRFVERGCEHGHDVEDWMAAERELARYEIVLEAPGSNLIEVLRELRDVTGMELRVL